MADMEILAQLIKNTAVAPIQEEYGKLFVDLEEPQTSDSRTTIRNLPSDSLVIKVDSFRSPDCIFNGGNGECKRADYVIISTKRKCILYIEIKRTKEGWSQIVKQLMGAQCFISYCREIGKTFWSKRDFLEGYRNRFISIGHTSIAKRKTRIARKSNRHDAPEKALKIDWPSYLQYNLLAGGQ